MISRPFAPSLMAAALLLSATFATCERAQPGRAETADLPQEAPPDANTTPPLFQSPVPRAGVTNGGARPAQNCRLLAQRLRRDRIECGISQRDCSRLLSQIFLKRFVTLTRFLSAPFEPRCGFRQAS